MLLFTKVLLKLRKKKKKKKSILEKTDKPKKIPTLFPFKVVEV